MGQLKKTIPIFIWLIFSLWVLGANAGTMAKIAGGQPSVPGKWPWIVALVKQGSSNYKGQFCGGSLINRYWVVTAAHCVYLEQPSNLRVVANANNLATDTGQTRYIRRIIMHPKFNNDTIINDLALIQLSRPINNLKTLPLYTGSSALVNATATIIGWGGLSQTDVDLSDYPEQLHETTVPIVSNAACQLAYFDDEILNTMLCAGAPNGTRDTCNGDSGGPLVVKLSGQWRLAGITSWGSGQGCAVPGYYGVYTRISRYSNYINATIKVNYRQIADANRDNLVNYADRLAKYRQYLSSFKLWINTCWNNKDSCADVNKDGQISNEDYTLRNQQRLDNYSRWVSFYWLPELRP